MLKKYLFPLLLPLSICCADDMLLDLEGLTAEDTLEKNKKTSVSAISAPVPDDGTPLTADAGTIFLLQAEKGGLRDASGKIPASAITLKGGKIVQTSRNKYAVAFGTGKDNRIMLKPMQTDFSKGFSFHVRMRLEQAPSVPIQVISWNLPGKQPAQPFSLTVTPSLRWTFNGMMFQNEKIDSPDAFEGRGFRPPKSYPRQVNTMNGITSLPLGRWIHLAVTYDAATGLLTTWVNGGSDRRLVNPWRELFSTPVQVPEGAFPVLFRNAENLQISQILLSGNGCDAGRVPAAKIMVFENPYLKKTYLTVTEPAFKRPAFISVQNQNGGGNASAEWHELTGAPLQKIDVPRAAYSDADSDLIVRIYERDKEVFSEIKPLINPSVTGSAVWKWMREGGTYPDLKQYKPDWNILPDRSFTYKGKKIFPILLYFVPPEDLDFVAGLGFNQVSLIKPPKISVGEWKKLLAQSLAKAAELGITITVDREQENVPGQGFIGAFDEPWGVNLEFIRRKYMNIRSARSHWSSLPVTGAMNNAARYRETSQGSDIPCIDPYPIHGGCPLRFVYDMTAIALRETDGMKPVMTVLENYGRKTWRPTEQELRAQCYLAVAGGASALSFYAWNEQSGESPSTRELPEQIAAYRNILGELKSLEHVLVAPNLPEAPSFEPARPRGFFACAKNAQDGKTYLFAVSDLYKEETRTMIYPPAGNCRAVCIQGSHDPLVFENGRAVLTLPAFGTAVFVLEKSPSAK